MRSSLRAPAGLVKIFRFSRLIFFPPSHEKRMGETVTTDQEQVIPILAYMRSTTIVLQQSTSGLNVTVMLYRC